MIPEVKVFLPTYQRNTSFQRCINSLINQTLENWVCEIHNDDPMDITISEYLRVLNDSRFVYVHHEKNLGPVVTFNMMYAPTEAKYVSLLEDDNWWEPTFLEEMVNLMDKYPESEMAWSNMYLWKEKPDSTCDYLNKTIWPISTPPEKKIDFGLSRQSFGALHSNGAMLIRNLNLQKYVLPPQIRFDFVEPFRERAFNYPIVFNSRPLANYNFTLSTNRKINLDGLYQHYILLLSSFFEAVSPDKKMAKNIWTRTRLEKVKSTNKLIYAGLVFQNCRFLLKHAKFYDWLFFLAYNLRHPTIFFECVKAKSRNKLLWEYLVKSNGTNSNHGCD